MKTFLIESERNQIIPTTNSGGKKHCCSYQFPQTNTTLIPVGFVARKTKPVVVPKPWRCRCFVCGSVSRKVSEWKVLRLHYACRKNSFPFFYGSRYIYLPAALKMETTETTRVRDMWHFYSEDYFCILLCEFWVYGHLCSSIVNADNLLWDA